MSLYLPEQKLGSRSQPGSSSHKFVVKGRQTGSMHRGHTWVFRAETYETMLAWYDDIKSLTEKSGEERNAFVRRHASVRSTSAGSARSAASSDGGLEEDEADAIPYSANQSITNQAVRDESPQRPSRPSPGGRFPSDLMVNRNLQAPLSPSSGSSEVGHDLMTAAGGLQQDVQPLYPTDTTPHQPIEPLQPIQQQQAPPVSSFVNPYPPTQQPHETTVPNSYHSQPFHPQLEQTKEAPIERRDSDYGSWMAPAAGGAAAGGLASYAYQKTQMEEREFAQQQEMNKQARLQNQEQHYAPEPPRTMSFLDPLAAPIPERHPDHIAPDHIDDTGLVAKPTVVAMPVVAPTSTLNPAQANVDSGLITPATTADSFLADSEAGTSVPFGKTINGGPVPADLIETAQGRVHPGVMRQNTDISVSDLHVPGEYPRGRAVGTTVPT